MLRHDMENTLGIKTPKGDLRMLSSLLDSAVFPGMQGGPLEHVIAAKAVAFGEALSDDFKQYGQQVMNNAHALAEAFVARGYHIVSGGTDNHLMLIDLKAQLKDGDTVPFTLVVQGRDGRRETVELKAQVRPINAMGPAGGHSGHAGHAGHAGHGKGN